MGIAFLFVIGLCVGSFINALVWRLVNHKDWVKGRSECPDCHHKLAAKDLVPIISWLQLRGKCRYCSAKISRQYPVVELFSAVWFASSLAFWDFELTNFGQWALFAAWLISSVGLISLIIYDQRWMILPTKIIYSFLGIAVVGRLAFILSQDSVTTGLKSWLFALLAASGIFFILHEVSRGQWIGFGDVRLGLLTGTLLGSPSKSLLMIFIASIVGSLFAIPNAIAKRKFHNNRFAYGPFLITATWFTMLFGQRAIDWYLSFF